MSLPEPRPQPTGPWEPPAEFDEYRLIRPIGRGRTGRVYLAHDTLLERAVAVKFIPAPDAAWLSLFMVEARAAARLQHPNVVTLYRVGQIDDRAYLVSEYIRGTSLDRLPRPLEWQRALEIAVDLARGLSAAHRGGVLHRDLKPGNAVLAETGEVKLLDFGLAKLVDGPEAIAPAPADLSVPGPRLELSLPDSLRGKAVGTPYFIAPEIWRGEEASPQSDLYSLGVLLYELCAGRGPFRDVPFEALPEAVQAAEARPLAQAAPAVDPRFAALIDRCLARDPARRLSSADALLDELEQLARDSKQQAPDGNPYRGLLAFEAEHRNLFFGRRREVRGVVDRLRGEPFLLLTGDSGVGKSSLCQAGVSPAVLEGALRDGRSWRMVRMVPGRKPLSALAAALSPVLGKNELAVEEQLAHAPEEVVRALRLQLGGAQGLLVYVDQLEELSTLSEPAQAEAAARALGKLAQGYRGLRLLGSARSDFLSRLARLPELGELVRSALYLVRGLNREETREAIVGPALLKGARFESEALVDALVDAGNASDGALPILQFALAQLWERCEQGVLRASALEEMGGVEGALARHADGVLRQLLPAQRRLARRVLLRLVTLEGTRARRTREELGASAPELGAVTEVLVQGRLVVSREVEGSATLELVHEALISRWGTLSGWLAEAEDERTLRHRLELAALEWERLGRARDALWSARQLQELELLGREPLSPRELEFVAASRRRVERARWVARSIWIGAVLLLLAGYAGTRLYLHLEQTDQLRIQDARAVVALERARSSRGALEAARARAFALFDQGKRAEGERAWTEALSAREVAERDFAAAAEAFERELVLGPGRREVIHRVAGFIAERADFAIRDGQRDLAQELLARLALLDPAASAAWQAKATLSLRTEPGAQVAIAEIGPAPDWHLYPEKELGSAPLPPQSLAAGDYLLTVRAPGKPEVREPVTLERGERLDLELKVAPAPPPGFVYVPAGHFLFGSGGDESVRQFSDTAPIHRMKVKGFFISREETTYADWIAFLQALPAKERARRRPHVGSTGLSGQLDLDQENGLWRLALASGSAQLIAREGQPLRYPGRTGSPEVDWLRLPVAGISFDDAQAYVQWLSSSGKVPGARLCSEVEWERAARGADARAFPGGDLLSPQDANYDQTYGKLPGAFGPDPVGSHPASRSLFGVDDLAGNVWEWVRSSLDPGQPVARGGSYYSTRDTCRVDNRETPERTFRAPIVGLRVCADVPDL